MQFFKVFLGPSGCGITVSNYMPCILVWGSCITCCNVCVNSSELLLQDQGK